jgi:glycosyltransferase involved in cell wall biosynthesis
VAPEEIRFRPLRATSWKRAYTTWLDYERQGAWARRAEEIGAALLTERRHAAVISCGPWHFCNHEAGRRLGARSGLPFVMDLRDPWSLRRRVSEGAATPLFFALADRHERHAVEQASLVVVNAEPVRLAMAAKYPRARARFVTVTNGYDDEPAPVTRHGERFTLAYAGGIYLDRDPRLLFRACAMVVRELGLSPREFGFDLIGNVEDYGGVPVSAMAREEGLDGYVTTGPARPRAAALDFLAAGTMLVSLPQDSPWAIPSKIFEYMLYDAWLLVLADEGSPAELLLRGSGADVVPTRGVEAMAAVIRARVLAYRRGDRPERLAREARFGRRHQARILMDALAACAGAPAGASRAASPASAAPAAAGA